MAKVVKTRRVRWQMISVMVLMSSFQLSAINGIQFYFDQVFITAGIPPDLIDYVKLGVLVAELLVTALSVKYLLVLNICCCQMQHFKGV